MKTLRITLTCGIKFPFFKIGFESKQNVDIIKEKYLIMSLNDFSNKRSRVIIDNFFNKKRKDTDDFTLEPCMITPRVSLSDKGREKTVLERKKDNVF